MKRNRLPDTMPGYRPKLQCQICGDGYIYASYQSWHGHLRTKKHERARLKAIADLKKEKGKN